MWLRDTWKFTWDPPKDTDVEFRGLRGGEGHASPPRWPEVKAVVQWPDWTSAHTCLHTMWTRWCLTRHSCSASPFQLSLSFYLFLELDITKCCKFFISPSELWRIIEYPTSIIYLFIYYMELIINYNISDWEHAWLYQDYFININSLKLFDFFY